MPKKNAVPNGEKTQFNGETSAEMQRRGVEKKRQKKTLRETWDIIRKMPLLDGEQESIEEIQSLSQITGANVTVEQAMLLAIAKKAMKGDIRAFNEIQKLTSKEDKRQELENKKAELEIRKLQMELDAYSSAVERANNSGVMIVDDIPDSNKTD